MAQRVKRRLGGSRAPPFDMDGGDDAGSVENAAEFVPDLPPRIRVVFGQGPEDVTVPFAFRRLFERVPKRVEFFGGEERVGVTLEADEARERLQVVGEREAIKSKISLECFYYVR